jgi:hypothetical protein
VTLSQALQFALKQIALERLIFLHLRLLVFGIYTLNPPASAGE